MAKIQLRRDTTANWASANPVLAEGEVGIDTTLRILKMGDGVSVWSAIPGVRLGSSVPYVNPFNSLSGIPAPGGSTLTVANGILSASGWTNGLVSGAVDTNRLFTSRDQWCETKVGAANVTWTGPAVRCTNMGNGYTQGIFGVVNGGSARIYMRSPATNTSGTDPSGFSFASRGGISTALGDIIRLEVRGAEARLYQNGTEILAALDGRFFECFGMYPGQCVYDASSKADEMRAGELATFAS